MPALGLKYTLKSETGHISKNQHDFKRLLYDLSEGSVDAPLVAA